MAELSPVFLDGLTYPAKEDRKLLKDLFTEGILTSGALAVTQHSTPAMSVDVALGKAIITNDEGNFGNYLIENDGPVTKTIAASDPSNPRIDRIIAQVYDATDISGAVNSWALEVLIGTPAASPAAPALPSNALDISLIAVAANAVTIVNADIADHRPRVSSNLFLDLVNPQTKAGVLTLTDIPVFPAGTLQVVEFQQDIHFVAKTVGAAADRYKILSPNRMYIYFNSAQYYLSSQATLDLSLEATWDTIAGTDYRTAANRSGKDFYIYACAPVSGISPTLKVSATATYPSGYNATTSKKIGGFHCLSVAVGTIAGHTLTGYLAGDVLPQSVWDLTHRPDSAPEGMVYDSGTGVWVDIYLASVVSGNLASVNGGTIADGASATKFHWYKFSQWMARIKKKLPDQYEFVSLSLGANQGSNIAGSADPVTTGGHSCYELLTLDVAPGGAGWAVGNTLTGVTSAKTCKIVAVLTTLTYVVVSRSGAFTFGEVITNGTNTADQGISYPTFAVDWINGGRMISNIGCEDCCGVMWQWGRDRGGPYGAAAWANAYDAEDTGVGGQHYDAPNAAFFGGAWDSSVSCGSRGSDWNSAPLYLAAHGGARGVSSNIGVRLN